MPLKILARGAIYPEDSIDRLLLANLRIKNLISEYTKLQKKARLILLDQTMIPAKTDDRPVDNHAKQGSDTIEDEKAILNNKLFNINRLSRLTQDDIPSDEIIFIENYSSLKNKITPSSRPLAYVAGSTAQIDHTPDRSRAPVNTVRQNFTGQDNNELPWVFSFLITLLNYLLNNRVEIILYMMPVCLVGFIISLYLRRREL
jgi:hypothetical protein